MNATPIHIGTMTCVIVSMLDITERKQMERELRRYNENLEDLVQEKVQELATRSGHDQLARAPRRNAGHDTGGHLKRLGDSCRVVATVLSFNSVYSEQLTYDFIYNLQQASMLHDIGKVGIPDSICSSRQAHARGIRAMKQHTTIGAETSDSVSAFRTTASSTWRSTSPLTITSAGTARLPQRTEGNEIPLLRRSSPFASLRRAAL
jgi:putative two-component system response regulator